MQLYGLPTGRGCDHGVVGILQERLGLAREVPEERHRGHVRGVRDLGDRGRVEASPLEQVQRHRLEPDMGPLPFRWSE